MTEPGLADIAIARWGDSGSRVVLVHGGVQGSASAGERNFSAQQPLGQEGWRLIVPDRPGHGNSPDPGRGDDAEADAVWVAELLGDRAHVVGHSFGGLVAIAAAASRPDAVISLVLIEPGAHKIATKAPSVRRFLMRMAFAILGSFSSVTRAQRVMAILGIPVATFGHDETQLARMGRALKRGKFPAKAAITGALATIRDAGIPLLVVSGGWNDAFVETGKIVADAGGGEHVIAPSVNHFPQWNGTSFNPLLVSFWHASERRRFGEVLS